MNLNQATLIGRLTRDPEVRTLPSGGQVTSFSVATNRTFKDKAGAKQEQTEFHNVVAFGRVAEIIGQYVRKGQEIMVQGRIQTRSWEADGAKKQRTEIVCEEFQFGAKAAGQSREDRPSPSTAEEMVEQEINPEDVPF